MRKLKRFRLVRARVLRLRLIPANGRYSLYLDTIGMTIVSDINEHLLSALTILVSFMPERYVIATVERILELEQLRLISMRKTEKFFMVSNRDMMEKHF